MAAATAQPSRSYAGVPAGDRRDARRERLLDAALDLLGSEGAKATTVRAVCARARLTPRYFYESFEGLDDLLVALLDRIVGETTVAVLDAVQAAPPDALAKSRAAIGTFVALLTDDPRKGRVAFVEALGNEAMMRRRLESLHAFAGLVAAQARDFYGARGDHDPLVDLTAELLVGGIAELMITWLDGGLDMTRDELVQDCSELFVATGETAVAIARRRAAAADGTP